MRATWYVPTLIALTLGAGLLTSCQMRKAPPTPAPPPSKVENGRPEGQLATVELLADAAARIGIETEVVRRAPHRDWLELPGEVVLPPGRSRRIAAPFAARVRAPETGAPAPLARVAVGQVLFLLEPLPSPDRTVLNAVETLDLAMRRSQVAQLQGEARALEATARVRLEGARVALDRARELVAGKVGSQAKLDEATLAVALAETELRNAETRVALVDRLDESGGTAAPAPSSVRASIAGLLTAVHVGPGDEIPAGAPLCEVTDDSAKQVSTAVAVGDLDRLAPENAQILALDGGGEVREGRPVLGPWVADTSAGTVRLFHALDSADDLWVGHRVRVRLPLRGEAESLVVPHSAIVYDFDGGAWVYRVLGSGRYRRVRVAGIRRDGDRALLVSGPEPGQEIVKVGAIELLGAELGIGK